MAARTMPAKPASKPCSPSLTACITITPADLFVPLQISGARSGGGFQEVTRRPPNLLYLACATRPENVSLTSRYEAESYARLRHRIDSITSVDKVLIRPSSQSTPFDFLLLRPFFCLKILLLGTI